ncbi:hypothetical protein BDV98DRAFT_607316 [Pterulicium gracile]|uniref:Zn(2)-C6 fungal-type domain-containing protein n=1 Tax=Pterulicium gracile TaxID=1884261 RepID=A0A5C3Q8E9_9AGAR|nr:hypothetical protein BDV98DRAFT_607316 [Pterula gracilis]
MAPSSKKQHRSARTPMACTRCRQLKVKCNVDSYDRDCQKCKKDRADCCYQPAIPHYSGPSRESTDAGSTMTPKPNRRSSHTVPPLFARCLMPARESPLHPDSRSTLPAPTQQFYPPTYDYSPYHGQPFAGKNYPHFSGASLDQPLYGYAEHYPLVYSDNAYVRCSATLRNPTGSS